MANEDGTIYWFDPDPRAILPLDTFHVPRSLARTVRRARFKVTYNADFPGVMQACAEPAPGRETTWINQDIIETYTELHELGFAHSVECWLAGKLAGGLYGVTLGGLFAGESMFSHKVDASKVALVHLVAHLKQRRFQLLDVQFSTEHLKRFGVIEIPREAYKARLWQALQIEAQF